LKALPSVLANLDFNKYGSMPSRHVIISTPYSKSSLNKLVILIFTREFIHLDKPPNANATNMVISVINTANIQYFVMHGLFSKAFVTTIVHEDPATNIIKNSTVVMTTLIVYDENCD
jgi:hypothetical protein